MAAICWIFAANALPPISNKAARESGLIFS
jgi:hypothetical protein